MTVSNKRYWVIEKALWKLRFEGVGLVKLGWQLLSERSKPQWLK
jgi:hypothetical protein